LLALIRPLSVANGSLSRLSDNQAGYYLVKSIYFFDYHQFCSMVPTAATIACSQAVEVEVTTMATRLADATPQPTP
jgi:hypothetical protein